VGTVPSHAAEPGSISAQDNALSTGREGTENTPASALPLPTSTSTPFDVARPPAPVSTYPRLRLQGIFYRQGDPFVIINSQTLTLGDQVDEVTIMDITPDSVVLRWKGETKTLTLR